MESKFMNFSRILACCEASALMDNINSSDLEYLFGEHLTRRATSMKKTKSKLASTRMSIDKARHALNMDLSMKCK
jgi:hypothetical protein